MNLSKILEKEKRVEQKWPEVASISTLNEYLAIPKEKRYKFGFWYITPFAMVWDIDDFAALNHDKNKGQGFKGFRDWSARIHPVQFFFREWLWDNEGYWFIRIKWSRLKDYCHWLKCRWIKPTRLSIHNAIGWNWRDCTSIIPDCLFSCIISFVEEEKGLEYYEENKKKYESGEYDEDEKEWMESWAARHLEIDAKIIEIYNFIKIELPKMAEYDRQDTDDFLANKITSEEIQRREQERTDLITFKLIEIIKIRDYLWT